MITANRILIALALITWIGAGFGNGPATADEPTDPNSPSTGQLQLPTDAVPKTEIMPPKVAKKSLQEIREALQGKNGGETGDGMLDDVLGVIQRQGSILDNSIFDDEPVDLGTDKRRSETPIDGVANSQADINSRAAVAEHLLRVARMLVESEPMNQDRLNLVARMRLEAVKLLSQPVSSEKSDLQPPAFD